MVEIQKYIIIKKCRRTCKVTSQPVRKCKTRKSELLALLPNRSFFLSVIAPSKSHTKKVPTGLRFFSSRRRVDPFSWLESATFHLCLCLQELVPSSFLRARTCVCSSEILSAPAMLKVSVHPRGPKTLKIVETSNVSFFF